MWISKHTYQEKAVSTVGRRAMVEKRKGQQRWRWIGGTAVPVAMLVADLTAPRRADLAVPRRPEPPPKPAAVPPNESAVPEPETEPEPAEAAAVAAGVAEEREVFPPAMTAVVVSLETTEGSASLLKNMVVGEGWVGWVVVGVIRFARVGGMITFFRSFFVIGAA